MKSVETTLKELKAIHEALDAECVVLSAKHEAAEKLISEIHAQYARHAAARLNVWNAIQALQKT